MERRNLYEKKGFPDIFVFAAKLCGMSEKQVRLAINLDARFEDKPTLKKLLVEGEVSIHKLARVVSIATPENEAELAEKIQLLPKSSVETLVRDIKYQNGLFEAKDEPKSLPGQTLNFEFSNEVIQELNALHAKGFDMNVLVMNMLQKRIAEIAQKKEAIGEEMLACNKPTEETEHLKRFAMSPDHDPRDMRRFCKDHHKISHTIDVQYQRARERALVL